MNTMHSLHFTGLQKPLKATEKNQGYPHLAHNQGHDSLSFSGKKDASHQPKTSWKKAFALGALILGAASAKAMAVPTPVNNALVNTQSLPTPAPSPVVLDKRQEDPCPICSVPPPEEEESSTSSSTTSTDNPAPSNYKKRNIDTNESKARENLRQAKAKYHQISTQVDEVCPDRKSIFKKECTDARKQEFQALRNVGKAQAAFEETRTNR